MATKLNVIDSTAASSFEMGDIDLGNPASEVPSQPTEAPEPLPEQFNEISDDFFDQELAMENQSSEAPTSNSGEAEASDTPTPAEETSLAEVSIDAFKKEHKFKLDPSDADLRRTLRNGIKAPKIKAELDKALTELKHFQSKDVQDKIQVWDELKDFASQGDYDRVFQAILGENYQQFLDKKISDKLEYEDADPIRRSEIDKERMKRDYDYKDRQREKQIKDMEAKAQESKDQATLDKWEGFAVPALQKFGFDETLIADADRRNSLNQKLWKLSWDDIEENVDSFDQVSPGLVAKVFKRNAELMKYSTKVAAEAKVEQITTQKKEAAAKTAANIATSNYPKANVESGDVQRRVDAWAKSGAKSAKDLLKFFK